MGPLALDHTGLKGPLHGAHPVGRWAQCQAALHFKGLRILEVALSAVNSS